MAAPVDPIRVLPFNAPGGFVVQPHRFDGIVTDKISTADATSVYTIQNKSNTLVFHVYPSMNTGDKAYEATTPEYKHTIVFALGDETSFDFDAHSEFDRALSFYFLTESTTREKDSHNIASIVGDNDTLTIGRPSAAAEVEPAVTKWIWQDILGNTGVPVPPPAAPTGRYVALVGEDTITDNFIQAGVTLGAGDAHLGAKPVTYLRGDDALRPTVPVSYGVLLVRNNLGIVKTPMTLFETKTVDPADLDAMKATYRGVAASYEANVEDDTEPLAKANTKLSPVQATLVALITPYFG